MNTHDTQLNANTNTQSSITSGGDLHTQPQYLCSCCNINKFYDLKIYY